jgi:hypothetical protein
LSSSANDWNDFRDKEGNTLYIGKLQFVSKGKEPQEFIQNVYPQDVQYALKLLVNLFLEQTKISQKLV